MARKHTCSLECSWGDAEHVIGTAPGATVGAEFHDASTSACNGIRRDMQRDERGPEPGIHQLSKYTISPFFALGFWEHNPDQSSATFRQAVRLQIAPESSPMIILRSVACFPASGPFLIRMVSGSWISRTAARRLALRETLVVFPDLVSEASSMRDAMVESE